jgi:hypothetical protein
MLVGFYHEKMTWFRFLLRLRLRLQTLSFGLYNEKIKSKITFSLYKTSDRGRSGYRTGAASIWCILACKDDAAPVLAPAVNTFL